MYYSRNCKLCEAEDTSRCQVHLYIYIYENIPSLQSVITNNYSKQILEIRYKSNLVRKGAKIGKKYALY